MYTCGNVNEKVCMLPLYLSFDLQIKHTIYFKNIVVSSATSRATVFLFSCYCLQAVTYKLRTPSGDLALFTNNLLIGNQIPTCNFVNYGSTKGFVLVLSGAPPLLLPRSCFTG